MSITIKGKTTLGPNIVTDGLVVYLDAGNTKSYPGSGTLWNDISGNGNNATLYNGPNYSSLFGGIIVFNGNYASVNVDNFIRNNTAYTISSFFYVNNIGAGSPYSVMTYPISNNTNDGFWQHIDIGDGTWLWRTEDNVAGEYGGTVSTTPFSSKKWFCLTSVVKTNTIIYYLNGLLYTTIATVFNWSNLRLDGTAYLYIPTGYGENYHMDGSVSNINLYNRELSSTEIFQNFNSQKSRFGL